MMELLIAALATWQAVEIWHHSTLFADLRARVEVRGGFLAALLGCPFCTSVWVALAAAALSRVPVAALLVEALAVSRLANLGNDVFHAWCRTPRETLATPAGEDEDHGL